jgi:dTDP-4-dehydrorhamnose reductase
MHMKILITGACGMIARALVKELEPKHELVLLDRIDPAEATVFVPGSAERAPAPLKVDWPFIKAEILDDAAIRATFAQVHPDAVVHLAAGVTGLPEVGVERERIRDDLLAPERTAAGVSQHAVGRELPARARGRVQPEQVVQ